jgi:cell division protein FtsI (penicillin-binding protein 3)
MMEQVVERGTAKVAQIEGYSMAAKTGTAAKVVDGRYSKTFYNASVGGFVPARSPVATILVTIDSPRVGGYFGAQAAGPVFRNVAEAVLRRYGVPTDDAPVSKFVVARHDEDGHRPVPTPIAVTTSEATPRTVAVTNGLMPDLAGLAARDAVRVLAQLGLRARLEGRGSVASQSIAAGEPVARGDVCLLTLSRVAPVQTNPVDER